MMEVGSTCRVEGRGHADEHRIGVTEATGVCRGGEPSVPFEICDHGVG